MAKKTIVALTRNTKVMGSPKKQITAVGKAAGMKKKVTPC